MAEVALETLKRAIRSLRVENLMVLYVDSARPDTAEPTPFYDPGRRADVTARSRGSVGRRAFTPKTLRRPVIRRSIREAFTRNVRTRARQGRWETLYWYYCDFPARHLQRAGEDFSCPEGRVPEPVHVGGRPSTPEAALGLLRGILRTQSRRIRTSARGARQRSGWDEIRDVPVERRRRRATARATDASNVASVDSIAAVFVGTLRRTVDEAFFFDVFGTVVTRTPEGTDILRVSRIQWGEHLVAFVETLDQLRRGARVRDLTHLAGLPLERRQRPGGGRPGERPRETIAAAAVEAWRTLDPVQQDLLRETKYWGRVLEDLWGAVRERLRWGLVRSGVDEASVDRTLRESRWRVPPVQVR